MTKRGTSRKQQEHAWRVRLIQKLETGEMPMEEKDRKKLIEFLVNRGPLLAALEKGDIDLPNPNKDVHGIRGFSALISPGSA